MSRYLGYSSRPETSAAISRIQARHNPPPSNQPAAPPSCPDPSANLEPMSSAAPPEATPAEAAEKSVSKFADKPWKGQAKKFARNMLLQYAMFKVLGPDKWRFAGFYHPRNAAYHSVINAKAAGITVLDIGAGTGELAMVASRAGAENVVTLEGTKPASRLVAKVCGANKIKNVLPCHDEIETMEVGEDEDLEEPAALVTMQVTDVALFGTALARLAEVVAHPQMVAPGAQFVPARARVFVAAVEAFPSRAAVEQPVWGASGFDVSDFNVLRTNELQCVQLSSLPHRLISAATPIFELDFSTATQPGSQELELVAETDGTWHAVVVWHELDLTADGPVVSTAPSEPHSWQTVLFAPTATKVSAGDKMRCTVSHDVHNLRINFPAPADAVADGVDQDQVQVSSVSRWHWGMMNDDTRNSVYNEAIRKAIAKRPVQHILDIGSGSGLLAMMAARECDNNNNDSCKIVSVEAVESIATVAKAVVERNGHTDRITILNCMSTELSIGEPEMLTEPAQLCVSEIVDVGLLGEFCLPTMAHAQANLLAPDAQVIPCGATIHACLVQVGRDAPAPLRRPLGADDGHGFDLRAFNIFASETYEQVDLNTLQITELSERFDAFEFNLCGTQQLEEEKKLKLNVLRSGECQAIAFWFTLQLDEELSVCTGPESPTCWNQALFFWPEPALAVSAGAQVELTCCHDANRVFFEPPTLVE